MVSTGQGQAEVTKDHDVLIAYEYCVTHDSGVTLGVETNGYVYFVVWPQLQVTMSNEAKKGRILKVNFVLLNKHESYAVLSQDSNGVICFGVGTVFRTAQNCDCKFWRNDIAHSTEPSGGQKWMEWFEICHVDSPHVGLQEIFCFWKFQKSSVLEIFFLQKKIFLGF